MGKCPISGTWVSLSLKLLFGWTQSHLGKPKCSVCSKFQAYSFWRFPLSLRFLKMILTCPYGRGARVSGLSIIPSCFALSTLGWGIIHLTQSLGGGLCSSVSFGSFHAWWVLPGSLSILMTMVPTSADSLRPDCSSHLLSSWPLLGDLSSWHAQKPCHGGDTGNSEILPAHIQGPENHWSSLCISMPRHHFCSDATSPCWCGSTLLEGLLPDFQMESWLANSLFLYLPSLGCLSSWCLCPRKAKELGMLGP